MADAEKDKENNSARERESEIKSSLELETGWVHHTAVFITDMFGSMLFLFIILILFALWIIWNLHLVPGLKPFDPFPFPMLTMIVSLFAIVLSIAVLMSQNRLGKHEKLKQQVEFEINVRAEREITKVLGMLHDIQKKLGMEPKADAELEEMKEQTDIQDLQQKLNDMD